MLPGLPRSAKLTGADCSLSGKNRRSTRHDRRPNLALHESVDVLRDGDVVEGHLEIRKSPYVFLTLEILGSRPARQIVKDQIVNEDEQGDQIDANRLETNTGRRGQSAADRDRGRHPPPHGDEPDGAFSQFAEDNPLAPGEWSNNSW